MVSAVAQFDVYDNPNVAQREGFPYVVVIQSDHLDHYSTRFVLPLVRLQRPPRAAPRRLASRVVVSGETLYLAVHLCAPLPARLLRKAVGTLRHDAAVLADAVDAVMSGV